MLDINNLSVDFHTDGGVVHAVKNVSLSVGEGEIRGLVGESGSGKSVTSMTILGLLGTRRAKIASGEILLNGTNLLELSQKELVKIRGREIGLVSQNALSALDPSFTVGAQMVEVIRLHQKLSKADAYKEAVRSLELVAMPDPEQKLRAYQHQLSGGQRQRVVIAMALAARPRLLLADEPTTALDATVQKQILDLLLEINKELGTAILMVTHDFGVVSHMCDTVTVMRQGSIVEQGTAHQVLSAPEHPYTRSLISSVPKLHLDDSARNVPRGQRRLNVFQEA
ncbi:MULTISPECIES: ABC transporter ATP-binding protein [unclassified Dietzia]|uniref:ABC transporter ATP-binding protein n=1 Tax=unclassified Dietzia TaxID=2617939 RepID=UPI0015C97319|nr:MULTISPECIES: ABC transporter ATP-binding protein [unclassified Dietzia]MBB1040214.1 ABC transporter ATP-binding protein [Dietzia sp. Cai40]MBB1043325.1 ABC transporter ATP-binding protein [Dietzia sp. DQ11-44]MBB1053361.1 ABC transporter ATP-binding protein [Dietzia sp. B44]MDZ4233490.1 ABC transporter ATP-binding protein [Dietzia sp.]